MRRGSSSVFHISNHPTAPLLCPLMQMASLHHHLLAEVTSNVDELPLVDWALNAHQRLEATCFWLHCAQMASHCCCVPWAAPLLGEENRAQPWQDTTECRRKRHLRSRHKNPFTQSPPQATEVRSKPHGCLASLVL